MINVMITVEQLTLRAHNNSISSNKELDSHTLEAAFNVIPFFVKSRITSAELNSRVAALLLITRPAP